MALGGWNYSRRMRIQYSGSAQTNVQVPILLNASNWDFTKAKTDGTDIRITGADGTTLLPFYRLSYSSTTMTATLWVKATSLANGGWLFVYAGNSAASDASSYSNTFAKIVADVNTLALWHFDEASGTSILDATGNYTATLAGGISRLGTDGGAFGTTAATFATGNALTCDGVDGSGINVTGLLDTNPAALTISFWFKLASATPTAGGRLFNKLNSGPPYNLLEAYFDGGIVTRRYVADADLRATGPAVAWVTNRWYHFAVTIGTRGLCVYLDGYRYSTNSTAGMPGNGNQGPFSLMNYAATNNAVAGSVDELCVENRELADAEIFSQSRRSIYFPRSTQVDKLVKNASAMIAHTQAWEGTNMGEPSMVALSDRIAVLYQSYKVGSDQVAYSYTLNGSTVTKSGSNPILGNGAGSYAAQTLRAAVTSQQINGVYLMTVVDDTNGAESGKLFLLSSTDLITWTVLNGGATISANPSWGAGYANTCLGLDDDGSMLLYAEVKDTSWHIGKFRINKTGADTYTVTDLAGGPLTSLDLVTASGTTGGPFWKKSGGVYQLWYHAAENDILPTSIYYAESVDGTNFVKSPWGPVIPRTLANEVDQTADPTYAEYSGGTYSAWGASNNATAASQVNAGIYAGTLVQFTADSPRVVASFNGFSGLCGSLPVLMALMDEEWR